MRIKEIMISELEKHFKNKWPREFAKKFPSGKFIRNERVSSVHELINLMKWYGHTDVYCTVYSFRDWHPEAKIRKQSARIDCVAFDLDSENLKESFREAQKLVSFLLSKKTIPRVYFSGSKGFHVYVDFPETEIKNFEVVKETGIRIAKKLNLKTVDPAVFEPARVIRIPFSRHGGSGLYCKPINAEKFVELDYTTMRIVVKDSSHFSPIEVHECKSFVKLLKYADFKVATEKVLRSIWKGRKFKRSGRGWRERRIRYYAEVLQRYGRLTADPEIAQRHGNEHAAKLHLLFLCFEQGMSDEEIHSIFRFAENYRPERTQYYIDYNRRRYDSKGGVANAD